ncbi:MAG TPA: hypothetical protein VN604_07535, partial [Nitrospirota bacterium]|nr:hypothetical protein [Nitrospirota bacterium]
MALLEIKKRLGELLVEDGIIQEVQLKKVLEEQKKRGGRVGEILVELKIISEHDLALYLAKHLNIPFVDLEKHMVDRDAARLISQEMARRLIAIPIASD